MKMHVTRVTTSRWYNETGCKCYNIRISRSSL